MTSGTVSWNRNYWFSSSRDAYTTGAAVVTCIDARFELVVRKLCKRWGIEHPDIIRIAGGPKALANGSASERDLMLEQLRVSQRLHGAARVLLIAHSDCGAYGTATQQLRGHPEQERVFHEHRLQLAAAVLAAELPDVQTTLCFVDFDGAWVMADTAACASSNESLRRASPV